MSFVLTPIRNVVHSINTFDANHARDGLDAYPDYPVYATVLYLAAVFFLPSFLKRHKKTYELKWVVASWNLFLSIVSTFGAYCGIYCLYQMVKEQGFYKCACVLPIPDDDSNLMRYTAELHGKQVGWDSLSGRSKQETLEQIPVLIKDLFHGPFAFFMAAFMYLKTPELLDTVFLILQGKPVSFLHWYHHIATAIFCWHAAYVLIPSGVFFATMNYFVHSIMYFYYFLVMMGLRAKIRPFAPVITVLQVLQMFIGMGITVYTYLQYWLSPSKSDTLFYAFFSTIFSAAHFVYAEAASVLSGRGWVSHEQVAPLNMAEYFGGCQTDTTNMRMGMMMYGSYCVLFVVLFKELYFDKRASKRSLVLARRASKEVQKPSPNNGAKVKSEREKHSA